MGIVEVTNIKKYYGVEPNIVKAVDDISITIENGYTVITGPLGSGKSTLLHLFGGLVLPTEGKIRVNHTDLSIFTEEDLAIFRRRKIGFIFRQNNLMPILNVYENIIFPLELDGREIDREYIYQIAELLKIKDKLWHLPKALSSGERQKVSIARALSTKPAIILADEPIGNLDSKSGLEVIGLLRMTCKEFNQAVIAVIHDKELAKMADQILHLKDGKLEFVEERRAGYVKK